MDAGVEERIAAAAARMDRLAARGPLKVVPGFGLVAQGAAGKPGNCYADAMGAILAGGDTDVLVHGIVTSDNPKLGRIRHAWVEQGDFVYEPTSGFIIPTADFYWSDRYEPEAFARYPKPVAVERMMKEMNYGPWDERSAAHRDVITLRRR